MASGQAKISKAMRLFTANQLADTRKLLLKLTKTDVRNTEAWQLLGMTEARLGRFADAAACFRNILSVLPKSPDAHYYLGAALEAQGDFADAIREYLTTIQLQPGNFKALYNLGNIYTADGLLEKAEEYYMAALAVQPQSFEALNNLASVLKRQSRLESALHYFHAAWRIRPEDASIQTNLGNTYHLLEDYAAAESHYRKALELEIQTPEAYCGLSGVLYKKGETGAALRLLAEARTVLPDDDSVIASAAAIHEESGAYNEAWQVLKENLEKHQDSVDLAISFAKVARQLDRVQEAINRLEGLLKKRQQASDRMRIGFMLGKLYDGMKNYENAYEHYSAANRLKPFKLDRSSLVEKFDRILSVFSQEFLSSAPGSGNRSGKPVFVVGMPRSGTSLVEQILSSHPEVFGAGELMDVGMIVASMQTGMDPAGQYPGCVPSLDEGKLREFADRYEGRIESLAPDAARVIDKMPGNFVHLGMIQLMFPGARIIHCLRNPLDTCLSCYFTDFLGYHPYAYDQASLGFYYCQYQRLMRHWKKVISLPLYTVEYEALVNNQEEISRELLDFCGLEWDDHCLEFHKTRRLVKTASYDQVRQPMYKGAIGRALPYREKLSALVNELDRCGCADGNPA